MWDACRLTVELETPGLGSLEIVIGTIEIEKKQQIILFPVFY